MMPILHHLLHLLTRAMMYGWGTTEEIGMLKDTHHLVRKTKLFGKQTSLIWVSKMFLRLLISFWQRRVNKNLRMWDTVRAQFKLLPARVSFLTTMQQKLICSWLWRQWQVLKTSMFKFSIRLHHSGEKYSFLLRCYRYTTCLA